MIAIDDHKTFAAQLMCVITYWKLYYLVKLGETGETGETVFIIFRLQSTQFPKLVLTGKGTVYNPIGERIRSK